MINALWVLIRFAYPKNFGADAILMSTHNISIEGDLTRIIDSIHSSSYVNLNWFADVSWEKNYMNFVDVCV